MLAFDSVWTETLKPIVWDPVVKDAGVAGDAGYTPQNTAIYTAQHACDAWCCFKPFSKMETSVDERMVVALIAWVCLAPVLRVLEDADFFHQTGTCSSSLPSFTFTLRVGSSALRFSAT